MDDGDRAIWTLIERVASGRATAAEWTTLDEWIGEDPRRRALVDDVRRIVRVARGMPQPLFDPSASLSKLRARLDMPETAAGPGLSRRRLRVSLTPAHRLAWWWSRAAAVLVAVGIAIAVASRTLRAPTHRADVTYTTARGQRLTLQLADGSRVVLAPASRLTIPMSFGDRDRSVILNGEGYFSVVHDSSKPFVVRAAHLIATDVGTSFDVRAYSADTVIAVSVREGRVSLTLPTSPSSSAIALGAGDMATVVADRGVVDVRRTDAAGVGGWTAGRLAFRGVPLGDVVRVVGRWYDVDLELGDSSLSRRLLTASFGAEPLAEVLLIITRSTGTRVTHRGVAMVLVPTSASRP